MLFHENITIYLFSIGVPVILIVTDCLFISVRIQLIGLVNTFKNSIIGEINYKIYNMSYIFKTIYGYLYQLYYMYTCTEEV